MNTCRIIRLVENVGAAPLLRLPKSVCYCYTTFSIWWLDYLSSHQPFELYHYHTQHQDWHPDIMYCTIASPPCQYLFENFLKYFLHTTYQKMQADLIIKFYLSNYTRFNLSLQIAIKILISYLDSRTALSRAAASARCSGVRSRLIGGLGGLNHDAGQCAISPSSSL